MRGMWTLSINSHIPRGMCRKLMIFNIFPTFPKTSVNCAQSPGNVHNPQSFWGLYTFPGDCAHSPIIHILRNIYKWRSLPTYHGKISSSFLSILVHRFWLAKLYKYSCCAAVLCWCCVCPPSVKTFVSSFVSSGDSVFFIFLYFVWFDLTFF